MTSLQRMRDFCEIVYVLDESVMHARAWMMALAPTIAFVTLTGCQSTLGPTSPTPARMTSEASISHGNALSKDGAPGKNVGRDEPGESADAGAQALVVGQGSVAKRSEMRQNALAQTSVDATVDIGVETGVDGGTGSEPLPAHSFQQPLGPVAGRTVQNAPAMGYANLSPQACRKQLRELKIPTIPARPAGSVATAVRLDGPLQGVSFRGPGPKSVFGTMDCRLVLALYEFAGVLSQHGVIEVFYGNTYRPNAKLPRRKKGARKPSQHSYGLAIDITGFVLHDGTRLMLPEDYHGEIGEPSCGEDAIMHEPNGASVKLRNIVCDVARKGVFHHMLTPNFNASHQEHFHFDIKRDGKWIVIR